MAFIWSTLNVKNLDESIKFYVELLELEVTNRFKAGPETEIAFLGNQSTKIELIENAGKSSIEIGEDISWGFSVVSLDKIISVLNKKNIPILKDMLGTKGTGKVKIETVFVVKVSELHKAEQSYQIPSYKVKGEIENKF